VPFKGLNTPSPAVGTVWMANFARARRAEGGEELTCWSPDTFGAAPDLFGELFFGDREGKTGPEPAEAPRAQKRGETSGASSAVRNGSFEELDAHGMAAQWGLRTYPEADNQTFLRCCSISADKAHRGKHSFRIDFRELDAAQMGKATQICLGQPIAREKVADLRGNEVILSMWINYDYIAIDAADPYYAPGPVLQTRMRGKEGPAKALSIILSQPNMTTYGLDNPAALLGNWVKVEQRGVIPADTERMDISVQHVAVSRRRKEPNITAVWVDDVRLEPASEANQE